MAPISIPVGVAAATAVKAAKTAIQEVGGTVAGDDSAGDFSVSSPLGDVKGNYAVATGTLTVTITDKPMFAPASMIEAKIREFFQTQH